MTTPTSLRLLAKAAAMPLGAVTGGRPGDLTILLYHRVGAGEREIDLPLRVFEMQMELLSTRYGAIPLDEALTDPNGRRVVVTFDDGYRDFHQYVLPVLVRMRIPAVLYLATGLVADGHRHSNPDALTWGELSEAVATGLVTVGSHTHSHADLSKAPERVAREEMKRSKDLVEDRLGVPCRHFAYPWSVTSPAASRVAPSLFHTAALEWRTNRRPIQDRYRLGRVPVTRGDGVGFFRAKVRGWLDAEALIYRAMRRGPWRIG